MNMNSSDEEEQVEEKSTCNKTILHVTSSGYIDGLLPKVNESRDQVEGGVVR